MKKAECTRVEKCTLKMSEHKPEICVSSPRQHARMHTYNLSITDTEESNLFLMLPPKTYVDALGAGLGLLTKLQTILSTAA